MCVKKFSYLPTVLSSAWVRWVPWNPSILRGGFSNPSIFENESIQIQYFEKLSKYIVFSDGSEPRLGSARAIFQKARIEKIGKNEPIWGLFSLQNPNFDIKDQFFSLQ